MKSLTTIKTITHATPLALLAVAMSGSAFAKGPNKEPQASIDMENHCYVQGTNLVIDTTIVNSSGDTPVEPKFGHYDDDGELHMSESLQAFVTQKGKKQKGTRGRVEFEPLGNADAHGAAMPFYNVAKVGTTTTTIALCDTYAFPLNSDSTVLNADIVVEVENSKFGIYSGGCDNLDRDNPDTEIDESLTPEDEDGVDDSIVNVDPSICGL